MKYDWKKHVLECLQYIDDSYTDSVFDAPFAAFSCLLPEDCPYNFPAATVGEALEFLLGNARTYHDGYTAFVFSWDVKAYNVRPSDLRNSALDSVWERYLDGTGAYIHEEVTRAAQDAYREEWAAYPGSDQGQWRFGFYGRSGGHLCLEKWNGNDLTKGWDSCVEFLASVVDDYMHGRNDDLNHFYIGIVCADHDFTRENASEEISYFYAQARLDWEISRKEDLETVLAYRLIQAANSTARDYGYIPDLTEGLHQELKRLAGLLADSMKAQKE